MLDTAAATPTCQHSRTLNVSATGQNWAKATSVAGHVTCIRKTGNEYFCQDGPGNQYAVVYDGTHLAYQPSP